MNKIIFTDNQAPAISASNLNQIQTNVENEFNNVYTCILPIGAGCDYYGTTAPTNYMFADGSAISRTEYAELFTIIGTTYGEGDGSTTFNLPDKRERVSVMYKENSANGTTGATLGILGAKGGEFKHTQTVSEMATHSHTVTSGNFPLMSNKSANNDYLNPERTVTFNINDTTSTSAAVAQAVGSSTPFNVMQPYLVCNYIIRVK